MQKKHIIIGCLFILVIFDVTPFCLGKTDQEHSLIYCNIGSPSGIDPHKFCNQPSLDHAELVANDELIPGFVLGIFIFTFFGMICYATFLMQNQDQDIDQ